MGSENGTTCGFLQTNQFQMMGSHGMGSNLVRTSEWKLMMAKDPASKSTDALFQPEERSAGGQPVEGGRENKAVIPLSHVFGSLFTKH